MASFERMAESPHIPLKSRRRKRKQIVMAIGVLVVAGILVWVNKDSLYRGMATISKEIPVLNQVFYVPQEPYADLTKEELIKDIEVLNIEVTRLNTTINERNKEREVLLKKIEGLKTYEEKHEEFLEQKEVWDKEIARSNPEFFIEQYELMYPEYAAEIYKEVNQVKELSQKQKEYARMIGEMEEEQAAKALEKIVDTDKELIKLIFEGMASERRSIILTNMSSQIAAQTIKLLSPGLRIE